MSTLLTVTGLGFRRNKRSDWLFRHLGFTVDSGEMVAVIGESGSGKSTLVDLLTGFAKPTEGRVQCDSEISVVLQEFSLYQDLTVGENLDFFCKINGRPGEMERWTGISGLSRWERCRAARLPLGYKKMLQLIVALTRECPLLILDDPAQGMDGENRTQLNRIVNEMLAANRGILYVGELEQTWVGPAKVVDLQADRLQAAPAASKSCPVGGAGVNL
jgi:ABC-2 type transport system ATP-binding protein